MTAPASDAMEFMDGAMSNAGQSLQSFAAAFREWVTGSGEEAAIAGGVTLGAFVILLGARSIFARILRGRDWRDAHTFGAIAGRAVGRIKTLFLLIASLAIAARYTEPPAPMGAILGTLLLIAGVIQAAVLAREILVSLIKRQAARGGEDASNLRSAISILGWFVNVVVWSVALLVVFDNLGVDVTALIAGLGVGGIAIGLAAQGIFADLFSALSILFDKPFRKGDLIIFNDVIGEVEEIGLKTTRVRALSGEQVVISNTNLLDAEIHNYERLQERRVVMTIGVTYQTAPEHLDAIPGWIREEFDEIEKARFDRAHFAEFAGSSLDFEIVFHVLARDYDTMMDMRHAVNTRIYRRFLKEGVDFAYPTRTLQLAAPDGKGVDPREIARNGRARDEEASSTEQELEPAY